MSKVKCGDANPKGNIALTYKGGCGKELDMKDAYRCTGCGGWFHKECLIKHFEMEKDHDWGREKERQRIISDIKFHYPGRIFYRSLNWNSEITNELISLIKGNE